MSNAAKYKNLLEKYSSVPDHHRQETENQHRCCVAAVNSVLSKAGKKL
jgi:hypothetical protein